MFFLLFFLCYKSESPNKVITEPGTVLSIINGAENEGTQVLCHGVVSILTCADIYSSFSPEKGGRHSIQMVSCK